MRHLPFLLILFASLALGQEVEPRDLEVEDQADLLIAQLETATIKGDFAANQAKLNGCSQELILNWQRVQKDLNGKFQLAITKERAVRAAIQEKYAAKGYVLNPQLAWVKGPGK